MEGHCVLPLFSFSNAILGSQWAEVNQKLPHVGKHARAEKVPRNLGFPSLKCQDSKTDHFRMVLGWYCDYSINIFTRNAPHINGKKDFWTIRFTMFTRNCWRQPTNGYYVMFLTHCHGLTSWGHYSSATIFRMKWATKWKTIFKAIVSYICQNSVHSGRQVAEITGLMSSYFHEQNFLKTYLSYLPRPIKSLKPALGRLTKFSTNSH